MHFICISIFKKFEIFSWIREVAKEGAGFSSKLLSWESVINGNARNFQKFTIEAPLLFSAKVYVYTSI